MTIAYRPWVYPCETPAEARASLAILARRRDLGTISSGDYFDIRRRLVRALVEPLPNFLRLVRPKQGDA
jgi:hypothetical protein